jgi:hypothetical protein
MIHLEGIKGDVLELSTVLSRPFWQCEARLFCDGDVQADVADVELSIARH